MKNHNKIIYTFIEWTLNHVSKYINYLTLLYFDPCSNIVANN